jgi:PUA domain protein
MRQDMVSKVSKNPRRHFLKEKEAKKLLLNFSQRFKVDAERLFGPRPRIEVNEAEAAEIFIVNGKPLLARSGGTLFPTLAFAEVLSILPRIAVDMGAVPHVCNGADVMAPGVVSIDGDFDKNDFLLVLDERHGKPLAIGTAFFNSQAMKKVKHGKIVKNIHHVGDKLWNTLKKI